MPQSAVKIFLRTRPSEAFATEQLQVNQDSKTVTVVQGQRSSGLPSEKSGPPQQYQFKFDGVLHNSSQEDVFELCALDVISAALEGYNGTIMCYGQTGAGKTYTMAGTRASYRGRGLVPRCIASTLARLAAAPGLAAWGADISYLEIYNEALYDLLDLNSQPHELSLYEDGRGHVQVAGLRKVQVTSEAEALALFFEGESNRVIGEHQLNRASSRSHSIFMMQLKLSPQAAEGTTLHSKLFLVDLAGSERVSKTRSKGVVLKEAGHINRSLALLEQVVRAASERGRDHVPYRSCKLTHVLKDSLGGNCRTVLIANVWGEQAQLDETLSTCRFSARMARLVCEVQSNVQQEGGARVGELQREVQELKEELAMMELVARFQQQQQQHDSSSSSGFEPYSEAQRQKLRESVRTWLLQPDEASSDSSSSSSTSLAPLPISSVRQLRELLLAFKGIVQQHVQQAPTTAVGSKGSGAASSLQQQAGSSSSNSWQQQQQCSHQDTGFGDPGDGSDAMMAAPDDARPAAYGTIQQQQQHVEDESAGPGPSSIALQHEQWQHQQQRGSRIGTPSRLAQAGNSSSASYPPSGYTRTAGGGGVLPVPPDRAAALEAYRAGPGVERAALLNDNHARLKAAKRRARELGLTLNRLKAQLDDSRVQQEKLKAARLAMEQDTPQALSPEEYQLVVDIRDIKAQYRDAHAELQLVRDEVQYTSSLLDTCKAELAADFEAWAAQAYGEPLSDVGDALMLPGSSRPDSTASSAQVNSSLHGLAVQQHQGGIKAIGAGGFSSNFSSMQRRQSSTPPLASLVGALQFGQEDADDPQAAAYYSAQHNLSGKVHRQGSQKKHRGERGTFTSTGRSSINDVAGF